MYAIIESLVPVPSISNTDSWKRFASALRSTTDLSANLTGRCKLDCEAQSTHLSYNPLMASVGPRCLVLGTRARPASSIHSISHKLLDLPPPSAAARKLREIQLARQAGRRKYSCQKGNQLVLAVFKALWPWYHLTVEIVHVVIEIDIAYARPSGALTSSC